MKPRNRLLMQSVIETKRTEVQKKINCAALPVVVVGTGPVGLRVVQALRRRDPEISIIIYGGEPWEPYNRVKLSSLLSGDIKFKDISTPIFPEEQPDVVTRFNCEVIKINTLTKYILDETGLYQPYSNLVLATGSKPFIPGIKGIENNSVFTLRNLNDAQNLLARQIRTRNVIVIGGGLLGIEAAKAMQQKNTEVTIIEHSPRLLGNQLDHEAAEILREYILSIGIHVRLREHVKEIVSNEHGISSVRIGSNLLIQCDTVIVSTGIKPNVALARDAHISVGRGIRVNDSMCTSVNNIYAVGECCEHRKKVYGLVAPGLEQAEVAAHSILKGKSKYEGSTAATNIKVIDKAVFSMGDVAVEGYRSELTEHKFVNNNKGVYRKLVIKNKRLVGAIAIGEWKERGRLRALIENKKVLMPWQLLRYKRSGSLFKDKIDTDISRWPSKTVICNCTGRTRGELSKVISSGCDSLDKLAFETGASSVCGSCKPLLNSLLGAKISVKAVPYSKTIGIASIAVVFLFLFFLFNGSVSYNLYAESKLQWDIVWRSTFVKQVSGFTILGLSTLAVLLSFRKRIEKINFGDFDLWRVIHIVISVLVVMGLIAHTGFRLGNNLNAYLMISFIGMLLVGSLSAVVISISHKLDAVAVTKIKNNLVWGHILFFWPIPALLTFHVLKSYYF